MAALLGRGDGPWKVIVVTQAELVGQQPRCL